MSDAFNREFLQAKTAGFKTWIPGSQDAVKQNLKAYVQSIPGTPTQLQTRYIVTMANAGHKSAPDIRDAWNKAHNSSISEMNKILGIEKKSTNSSAKRK